jgi:cytosolic iron-sulfur protein assembly protein CIAO1
VQDPFRQDNRQSPTDAASASTALYPPPPSGAQVILRPLPPFRPDLLERAWCSVPHPTLPLLATVHGKGVTVFSLATLTSHSQVAGGHERSVRAAAWKPALAPGKLCLVTASFDSTAALWRWQRDVPFAGGADEDEDSGALETEIRAPRRTGDWAGDGDGDEDEWEFTLVLEGHESELKAAAFSPSGTHLATCSRDKSVWIWEDVGAAEGDDEWETVAVLTEHDGDVKGVAWCPDVPGRRRNPRYAADALASAGYDDVVRVWREDEDGEWVCVAVLEGHDGIVWGVQWEPDTKNEKFPRLLTWSADRTIRIWTLKEEDEDDDADDRPLFRTGLGSIPNRMRRSAREEWKCTATLPAVHTRQILSASWSPSTGRIASTGSDSIIAVYGEEELEVHSDDQDVQMSEAEASAELDGEAPAVGSTNLEASEAANGTKGSQKWRVLATVPNGHGPYEINHVTWCRRCDPDSVNRGLEEMLVTTGDDGVVRPWQLQE